MSIVHILYFIYIIYISSRSQPPLLHNTNVGQPPNHAYRLPVDLLTYVIRIIISFFRNEAVYRQFHSCKEEEGGGGKERDRKLGEGASLVLCGMEMGWNAATTAAA